ncbi:pentatricopeptide repeat-containing protein At4g02750-like [Ananas comosus]|uniref:Pentatricopeptide repeat-containing protein n=1 Tax=Ananas comosus TaxID=4615 RepID=A0A199UG19_ANACO|nr:pentatricopeptide repeat-containing protein At4g02750-like [Ananas comosus]OAY63661.1 Pentatricopeptide repeat-containing protein [Ananas comosus]
MPKPSSSSSSSSSPHLHRLLRHRNPPPPPPPPCPPPPLPLLPINRFTLPLLAKVASHLALPLHARALHARAAKSALDADLVVRNALLHMYSSLGDLPAARELFASARESDLVSWNSMIDGCAKNGMLGAARDLFDEMPERDRVTWNAMIAGYAAAGDAAAAKELFLAMPDKDVVSWNTMISGHARIGDVKVARELFDKMPNRDRFTWNAVIAGYAGIGDMRAAKELFLVMPDKDIVSWNTMISGYAKIGDATSARELFDEMPERDSVSWNVILALYARLKKYRDCLRLFDSMMAVGDVKPNEAIFVSVLTACANLGELERGKWVHSLITDGCKTIELDVLLSTALLTMYAKCGVMDSAKEVFDSMEERSVVSWNSMIRGYGLHGEGKKALDLFMEMEKRRINPNEKTFVCILSSCAHNGMVFEGWWCFDRMIWFYNIEPKVEHFGCMMDLLSRAGLLKDSEELMKKLNLEGSPALLGPLMSASTNHCNWKLGEFVGKKLIEMKPQDIGPYVLLSNIYAAEGRWDDVEKLREVIREKGLEKDLGFSLVGVEESESYSVDEEKVISEGKKSMVFSMSNEIGAHLKSSCRRHHKSKRTLVSTG